MQILTAATGERHLGMARAMAESMAEHGWPPLRIIAGRAGECGQRLKTRFGEFAEDIPGPVMFLDCDCLATGPFVPPPALEPGQIAARITGFFPPPFDAMVFMASTVVVAGDLATARQLCEAWSTRYTLQRDKADDEAALFKAAIHLQKIDLGGTYAEPLPNLRHLGATSAAWNAVHRPPPMARVRVMPRDK